MIRNSLSLRQFKSRLLIGVSALVLLSNSAVIATPEDGEVVRGTASIIHDGSTTTIDQSSNKAVINWNDFNIGKGETVNFNQLGADSVTLNRVTGDNVSEIMGAMNANGIVYLINRNGILFGQSARVDVGGLVASTFDISNDNFMQGSYIFSGAASAGAKIINNGSISIKNGGLGAFVAPYVENNGVISASLGQVMLGASETGFALDLHGDGLISFEIDGETTGAGDKFGVNMDGTIEAEQVLITAEAARELVTDIITVGGDIRATGASQEGGVITLSGNGEDIAVTGALIASGDTGGSITVTTDKNIYYRGNADASSSQGDGGSIRIGGDYQGNGDIQNAANTFIGEDATIKASAGINGDGGRVIVWADGQTKFYGQIEVKGGTNSGDGGFVEVSGKNFLAYQGDTDIKATNGEMGTLLLDPDDITISTDPTSGGGSNVSDNDAFADNSGSNSIINNSDLVAALDGANVTLQANDIIIVNAEIDSSGNTNTGNLSFEAVGLVAWSGDVSVNAPITLFDGATLSIESTRGSINIRSDITATNVNLTTVAADKDIWISSNGVVTIPGTLTVSIDAANGGTNSELLIQGSAHDFGTLVVTSADNVTVVDTNGLILGNITSRDELDITASGDITQAASSTLTVANGTTITTTGDIALDKQGATYYNFTLSGDNVSLTNSAGALSIGDITSTTDTTLFAAGSITQGGGNLDIGGALTVTAGTNSITLNDGTNDLGTVNIVSGGQVQLYDTDAMILADIDVTGNLTINAGGAVTQESSSTIEVVGATSLTASGSAAITLDSASNDFGNVDVLSTTNDVTLTDVDDIDLAAMSVDTLTVNAASVTDAGTVSNTSVDITASGTVTLDNQGSELSSFTISGADVVLSNSGGDTAIGSITANTLSVTSGGHITDVGTLNITTSSLFDVASGYNVTIDDDSSTSNDDLGATATFQSTAGTMNTLSVTDLSNGSAFDLTDGVTAVVTISAEAGATDISVTATGTTGIDSMAVSTTSDGMGISLINVDTQVGSVDVDTTTGAIDINNVDADTTLDIDSTSGNVTDTTVASSGSAINITTGGTVTLGDQGTNYSSFVIDGGGVSLTSTGALTLGDVTSSGDVSLEASGAITQGAGDLDITGTLDILTGSSDSVTLTTGTNDFGIVDITFAGATSITDTNGFELGESVVNDDLTITVGGNLTQTSNSTISVLGTTTIDANNNDVTLDDESNDFQTLSFSNMGNLALSDKNSLTLPSISATSIDIYAATGLTVGGTLTASATGDAIILRTAGTFTNTAGASALSASSGRFLVFAPIYSLMVNDGLAAANWYNTDFDADASTVTGTGDRFVTDDTATLTVAIDDAGRTYGAVDPTFTTDITGYVNSDTSSILTNNGTYVSTSSSASDVGDYDITGSNVATDNNYTINYTDGTLTVNKATLSVAADDANSTYGTAASGLTGKVTGFVNSETDSVISGLIYGTAATSTSDAGTYDITASGATATNYDFSYNTGTLTVGKATLTVAADDANSTYGTAVSGLTGEVTGFVNSETDSVISGLIYGTAATSTSDAGTYNITGSGATATNYDFDYSSTGTLTVGKVTLSVAADDASSTYGTAASGLTGNVTGFVNSETDSVISGLTYSTAATGSSNVGTYDITGSGASATNYDFSYNTGTLTVGKAPVVISADDKTKVEGTSNPTFTSQISGLVNGDEASDITGALYSTAATTSSGAGVYSIVVYDATSGNYSFSYNDAGLTVTSLPLTSLTLRGDGDTNTLEGDELGDFIYGLKGTDKLYGKGGSDQLFGGSGKDRLFGGTGKDTLKGGTGADFLNGGKGVDTASYMGSKLGITVNLGKGTAKGGDAKGDRFKSIENIIGTSQKDKIVGSKVDNKLNGGKGNDTLKGKGGADILKGGSGADTIDGGKGNDKLTGGKGRDTFVFTGKWGKDVIKDFKNGKDKIDLSGTGLTFDDLVIKKDGKNTVIKVGKKTITLKGIKKRTIEASDFIFATDVSVEG